MSYLLWLELGIVKKIRHYSLNNQVIFWIILFERNSSTHKLKTVRLLTALTFNFIFAPRPRTGKTNVHALWIYSQYS